MNRDIPFIVFTKYWKTHSLSQLADTLAPLGFDGVELPVRSGFQIEPSCADQELYHAQKQLSDAGLPILSVAAPLEEKVFYGCAQAGIEQIRIMFTGQNPKIPYFQRKKEMQSILSHALFWCRDYGVKIAVQPHYGPGIAQSMELYDLIKDYDPQYIGAIWDAGHAGLAGEAPEQGLDILWPYLTGINLKSAYYLPSKAAPSEEILYQPYFTEGREGLCSWNRATQYLRSHNFTGYVCIFAEYTDLSQTLMLTKKDLLYARTLMNQANDSANSL